MQRNDVSRFTEELARNHAAVASPAASSFIARGKI
jgi:hypothetical protein